MARLLSYLRERAPQWRREFAETMKDYLFIVLLGFLLGLGFWLALSVLALPARAVESIPRAAHPYRDTLIRAAHATWGLDAPVAVLAAQVHTESRWDAAAVSPVGAMGLAQIMPGTAAWLPDVVPSLRGKTPAPYNPGWALRAMCEYDLWLWERVSGATDCDRISFALSGYNGGLGWVRRDRAKARDKGLDPELYAAVAPVNAGRSAAAWRENRDYVRRVMDRQPLYRAWGPGVACE